jgi:glycosyltransferase involved in cell wall biosynthesis
MKKKYKVATVINHRIGGCVFYRQIMLHSILQSMDDFDIFITDNVSVMTDEQLGEFDILQYHKGYMNLEQVIRAQKLGVITVCDFDDYWSIPQSHLLYKHYYFEKNGQKRKYTATEFFVDILKTFNYITCPTMLLKNEIKRINPYVEIFENGVDPVLEQFQIKNMPSRKMRFGWIGGSCHLPDIKLLDGVAAKLEADKSIRYKYDLRLFGYTKGSVYEAYADVFTDKGRFKDNFLLFPATDVWNYTKYYNNLDVSLVPLVDDKFNGLKSELKLIEAGFFKKAVIVSNVNPYKIVINDKNSIIIRTKRDWEKKIKYCIKNPNYVKDIGERLYQDVKVKYNAVNIANRLAQWYRVIISKGAFKPKERITKSFKEDIIT